jgi:hypothetical protein
MHIEDNWAAWIALDSAVLLASDIVVIFVPPVSAKSVDVCWTTV